MENKYPPNHSHGGDKDENFIEDWSDELLFYQVHDLPIEWQLSQKHKSWQLVHAKQPLQRKWYNYFRWWLTDTVLRPHDNRDETLFDRILIINYNVLSHYIVRALMGDKPCLWHTYGICYITDLPEQRNEVVRKVTLINSPVHFGQDYTIELDCSDGIDESTIVIKDHHVFTTDSNSFQVSTVVKGKAACAPGECCPIPYKVTGHSVVLKTLLGVVFRIEPSSDKRGIQTAFESLCRTLPNNCFMVLLYANPKQYTAVQGLRIAGMPVICVQLKRVSPPGTTGDSKGNPSIGRHGIGRGLALACSLLDVLGAKYILFCSTAVITQRHFFKRISEQFLANDQHLKDLHKQHTSWFRDPFGTKSNLSTGHGTMSSSRTVTFGMNYSQSLFRVPEEDALAVASECPHLVSLACDDEKASVCRQSVLATNWFTSTCDALDFLRLSQPFENRDVFPWIFRSENCLLLNKTIKM